MISVLALGTSRPLFDDSGAQQHVHASLSEVAHHLFKVILVHLAVADGYTGFGDEDFEFFPPEWLCSARGCARRIPVRCAPAL